jgi:hypothetical protein
LESNRRALSSAANQSGARFAQLVDEVCYGALSRQHCPPGHRVNLLAKVIKNFADPGLAAAAMGWRHDPALGIGGARGYAQADASARSGEMGPFQLDAITTVIGPT